MTATLTRVAIAADIEELWCCRQCGHLDDLDDGEHHDCDSDDRIRARVHWMPSICAKCQNTGRVHPARVVSTTWQDSRPQQQPTRTRTFLQRLKFWTRCR